MPYCNWEVKEAYSFHVHDHDPVFDLAWNHEIVEDVLDEGGHHVEEYLEFDLKKV